MPKIYYIKNEVERPVEVYELKKDEYQVPTFEEFMKTYERDEEVNYADLEHSDIGDSKICGPCSDGSRYCSCCQSELQRQYWVAINNNAISRWENGEKIDEVAKVYA